MPLFNPSTASGLTENLLYNSWFWVWQRGTNFATAGATADRWTISNDGGTASRQSFTVGQTDVPDQPQYFFRHAFTSTTAGTRAVIQQKIDDARTLSGEAVTISFYIKSSVLKTDTLSFRWRQSFGTGGSTQVTNNEAVFTTTTAWQKFTYTYTFPSVSSKTIAADSFIDFTLLTPSGMTATDFDVANVILVRGSSALAYRAKFKEEDTTWSSNISTLQATATTAGNMGTFGTSLTVVEYDTVTSSNNVTFDTSTGKATIQYTGYYNLSASYGLSGGTNALNTSLNIAIVNETTSVNVAYARQVAGGATTSNMVINTAVNGVLLTAGDILSVQASNSGATATVQWVYSVALGGTNNFTLNLIR